VSARKGARLRRFIGPDEGIADVFGRAWVVTAVCLLALFVSGSAVNAAALHASGESTVQLPAGIKGSDVDGVVVEVSGKFEPVEVAVKGNSVIIKPCRDFEAGTACNVKVYTKSGK